MSRSFCGSRTSCGCRHKGPLIVLSWLIPGGLVFSNVDFGESCSISCPSQENVFTKATIQTGFNVSHANPGLDPSIANCAQCATSVCPSPTTGSAGTLPPSSGFPLFGIILVAAFGAAVLILIVVLIIRSCRKQQPCRVLQSCTQSQKHDWNNT